MLRRFATLLAAFVFTLSVNAARAQDNTTPAVPDAAINPEQEAFFEKNVRPILLARCLDCHGEKKQEGGIRLDSRPAMLKGGDTGPAIVPGKPEESRLVEVIGYGDVIKMPPKQKLSDDEIGILTAWIKQGAAFPGAKAAAGSTLGQNATPEGVEKARATHWSYQPITRPDPPAVKTEGWAKSTIDRFILAKLEAAGVKPNPAADKRTLLRRVTFDLTGLPPTDEEAQAFESDASDEAFTKVVDRLLDSPHYGERWGRHWLDVARYADTKGYVFTEERKYPFSYTYRDYVVNAFNRDLPFDRFIVEQLAADQLDLGDDRKPLAAMGFLTLGRRFGNKIQDIIDDRIDTVARGLMGMTVACARCHDHKYDAIPTDDYYSLYGVFASSIEPADLPQIGPPSDLAAFVTYEKELKRLEGEVEKYSNEKIAAMTDEFRSKTGDYLAAVVKYAGKPLPDERGQSIGTGEVRMGMVTRWRDYLAANSKWPHPVFAPWFALEKLPAESFAEGAATYVATLNDAADANPRTNALVKKALIEAAPKSMTEVAAVYGKLLGDAYSQWKTLKSPKKEPAKADDKPAQAGPATGAESPAAEATLAAIAALPDPATEEIRQVLYIENGPTTIGAEEARRFFDRAARDKVSALKRAADAHKANSSAAPPRAMVMNDAAKPTNPHVLVRGNPNRPGKEVPRRFLQVLQPKDAAPFQKGSGRLELATAIASPTNPLTARVIVNRIWLHHFGEGLVTTPSDFGFRGSLPSHPELLDYLAGSFIDEGWSMKKLHRRILLSAAYRQTSDDRADGLAADPENRLLWKMNRQRLEFEPMRDSLLAVAGKLDRTLGGRPVDLFSAPYTTRRAIYGFIDRQDLPGTFRVFDFASPDVSMPQRPETTVPQQALFAMNSPFVIERARQLAARPEVASAADPAAQVQTLYRLIYARAPAAEELAVGTKYLAEPQTVEPVVASAWQYGYGEFDEAAKKLKKFTALPRFQDERWRGGAQFPDRRLGWTSLTADGGHPGGTKELAAIRRWTAPRSGSIRITGVLTHPAEDGDGVRGRIVSSRAGELGLWRVHHGHTDTKLENIAVEAGDTIDFVVDCVTAEANDSFNWPPTIVMTTEGAGPQQWVALTEFSGPQKALTGLGPLEQYAQALLLANEFVFVD